MARKPENIFIGDVHKKVLEQFPMIYPEKTNNPFRGGIPDVYYDSPGLDMWAEYKWFDRVPPVINLVKEKDPILSELQQRWINRAYKNGRNVCVIVGFKLDGYKHGVFTGDGWHWNDPLSREAFLDYATPLARIPIVIAERLGVLS